MAFLGCKHSFIYCLEFGHWFNAISPASFSFLLIPFLDLLFSFLDSSLDCGTLSHPWTLADYPKVHKNTPASCCGQSSAPQMWCSLWDSRLSLGHLIRGNWGCPGNHSKVSWDAWEVCFPTAWYEGHTRQPCDSWRWSAYTVSHQLERTSITRSLITFA